MRVDAFDFNLPDDLVALRPADPRTDARLLHVRSSGPWDDRTIGDLPGLLREDDILVLNDTRVIPARLFGLRHRGANAARIEILLHMRVDPNQWHAFSKPAKKLAVGESVDFGQGLTASVVSKGEGGEVLLLFNHSGADLDAAIASIGSLPLPPYIAAKRAVDDRDRTDYQTMHAKWDGAVAAPTAGLHFTPSLVASLDRRGIVREHVTLHVGAGTFLPVKADTTQEHRMHAEVGGLDHETAHRLNEARAAGRRLVAVGTTSLRLLESATGEDGIVRPFEGATDIFITPGYRFHAVDALLTNFHLPRSTLFMLVSAFSGLATMRAAYAHAIAGRYRFYSYGDACLLEKAS